MGGLRSSGRRSWRVLSVAGVVAGMVVGFGLSPVGAASGAQTERVSVSSTGVQGNYHSAGPAISARGRFVAFSSGSSNLVRNDTNDEADVFVYDRTTQRIRRVSVSSTGAQANGSSVFPSISTGGRFVAYVSKASNLVRNDTSTVRDVFVYDRATHQTRLVSISSTGIQSNRHSWEPSVSGDGQLVAFSSRASNLVRNDTNDNIDVFVRDRTTRRTLRVSVSSTGAQANGESGYDPAISTDGRFVAFTSGASNLVRSDTNDAWDVFIYNRATQRTRRVSVSSTGSQSNEDSFDSSISADGRFVAFSSEASNLVPNDTNQAEDVFVHDRTAHLTRRVSISSTGNQSNDYSADPSISADGRIVAFLSWAPLVGADTNTVPDIFVYDRIAHQTQRVSVSSTGVQGKKDSYAPSISADGRFVAFNSDASNLVRNDTNGKADVFVRGPLH